MTLEDALFAALKTLVGNRVAPVIFPQPPAVPTWPAIRYSIETTPIVDACGDGDDSTSDARVQLDVVAKDFPSVRSLRLQVLAAMGAFDPPAVLQFSTGEYDEETKTFREILQYSIHGSSSLESP
jgi:Protein of unknown function (DUF3168)